MLWDFHFIYEYIMKIPNWINPRQLKAPQRVWAPSQWTWLSVLKSSSSSCLVVVYIVAGHSVIVTLLAVCSITQCICVLCIYCDAAMVCELLPSPLEMSNDRIEKLLCSRNHSFAMMPPATQQLKHGRNILCIIILLSNIISVQYHCV